jgi:hypothetical protein
VKELPILFSGPMVRAILEGRKSQTRRVVKPQPTGEPRPISEWSRGLAAACHDDSPDPSKLAAHSGKLIGRIFPFTTQSGSLMSPSCPYGVPGDRLWVRETIYNGDDNKWRRRADDSLIELDADDERVPYMIAWAHHQEREVVPSIFMPRWASRITLEVTGVRMERVQEISETDAKAEGVTEIPIKINTEGYANTDTGAVCGGGALPAIASYALLWDFLNAKRGYGWNKNPLVWVIEFRRVP